MTLRIAVVQRDFPVGDVDGNAERVIQAAAEARALGSDLVVLPELCLTGYPPEDLLYRRGFVEHTLLALQRIAESITGIDTLVGHPMPVSDRLYNAVSWIRDGEIIARYFKQALPNYAVFDEKRYFDAGRDPVTVTLNGVRVGLLICEDIWEQEPARKAAAHGCDVLVIPNASPFHENKRLNREQALAHRATETGLPIVYANLVGGQDELVFDGRSFAIHPDGEVIGPTSMYSDGLFQFGFYGGRIHAVDWEPDGPEDQLTAIYQTLVRGTRDYVRKNGFQRVLLGLSGGIDSGLTAAIAVDALGADNVQAVMLPSRHTSQLSLDLAREQAEILGIDYQVVSIESAFEVYLDELAPVFAGAEPDITEENIQARIRGNMLMAISNKSGAMLLTTGNKSEVAVGYCTIYGDMCGGYNPIKDCVKTRVYALAEYRNQLSPAVPQGIIDRPPSAELAPDQKDEDSLPPYPVLDEILARYVEQDESVESIAADFDHETVRKVARLVLINEYKRRQSAPGCRVTPRAFGRDRRYPITNAWHDKN
ncbi:MAG: NAD+ synthase [Xanthomonadales bacterium]|nr:NAD+ synthase [Xanthomonadales bacterium]